jgi:hypothetical protein
MVRMVDPKETIFKVMSWDEKATFMEKTVQETIKTREEMVSVGALGSPQVAPIQIGNFSEVQDIQGMGGLMYQ